jgi:hypothetical protein
MPNILELQTDNFFRFGRKKIHNRNVHRFAVHVSQIQCDLKDVSYWVRKKQGFPTIKDTGIVDVFLGGQGLSFDLKLATAEAKDRNRIFKVESVKVKVSGMNIVLKKSNHKMLFNIFKPFLMGIIKPVITKAAEVQIRRTFDKLDEQMYLVNQEYKKAREAAQNQSPDESTNMINQYIQAVQKRYTDAKANAKDKAPDAKVHSSLSLADNQVKVATTKETSLFPDVHLDDAISSKATKYREMALDGEEWRSPVFDLGTANQSNIPAPKKITRKSPHQNSRATINERQDTATGSTGNQGYTGLNELGGSRNAEGYSTNRQSSAGDSMSTAVDDQTEFEGTHVGKYNVTGSQLPQDPIRDTSRNVY